MPELTVASFNCHAGLRPRRRGVAQPYDLPGVLRALDAGGFEINVAPLETLAPIVRAVAPKIYRRAIVRTQPLP